MYYCEDHDSLMLTQDYEDRLVICGIKPETILKFAQEIVKKSLEKEVTPKKKATAKQILSSSPSGLDEGLNSFVVYQGLNGITINT